MQPSIQFNQIDVARISRRFQKLANSANGFAEPLRDGAELVVKESTRNFDTEGFLYGSAWTPLSQSTRRQRASRGYNPSRPILYRTGELKRGTRIGLVTNKEAVIENPVGYAKYHQFGTVNMPKRKVLGFSKNVIKAVGLVFANYIKKNMK